MSSKKQKHEKKETVEPKTSLDDSVIEYKTQLQRIQAEFDNYRKRVDESQKTLKDQLLSETIEKFIPILDHFELAAMHDCSDENYALGVKMIFKQFQSVLFDSGLKEVETNTFNPLLHDAIGTENDSSKDPSAIIAIKMKGYALGGKVIRKAKVIVNMNTSEENTQEKYAQKETSVDKDN